jgi:hypothetical protein
MRVAPTGIGTGRPGGFILSWNVRFPGVGAQTCCAHFGGRDKIAPLRRVSLAENESAPNGTAGGDCS